MSKGTVRTRILGFPHEDDLFDAHVESISEERNGRDGRDIVFHLRALRLLAPPEMRLIAGVPHEVAVGEYAPARLRFARADWLRRTGVYSEYDALAEDDGARRIFGVVHARGPELGESYLITTGASALGELRLRARACLLERGAGSGRRVEVARRWAQTPNAPPGLIPHRPRLHRRYAGDPIRVRLGRRDYLRRLFIGGLHFQGEARPDVDAVLNLCEVENPWCATAGRHSADRHACKGEMGAGMDAAELVREVRWVAERLREGQRVLVHCYAGINRSSTVCCAALMLLEGIRAEEALARVREHHPIAWPDPYYWHLLRWLHAWPLVEGTTSATWASHDPAAVLRVR